MDYSNVISMVARPIYRSYLCFEVGGILDTCDARLGDHVDGVSYETLCADVKKATPGVNLGGGGLGGVLRRGRISLDYSRLANADNVMDIVKQYTTLATLRNEDRKAALNTAVNTRQNIFFSKYASSSLVIDKMTEYYDIKRSNSKPNRLRALSNIAQQQSASLQEAYTQDQIDPVVQTTTSSTSTTDGDTERWQSFVQESVNEDVNEGASVPHNLTWPSRDVSPPDQFPYRTATQRWTQGVVTAGKTYEQATRPATTTTSVGNEYKTPYLESQAREHRAQISLMDQMFDSFMLGQSIPYLEQIFKNELDNVDNDVYRLQIAFLRSFLFPPLPGIVTGIYKRPGDAVNAGEPVIRIEDNSAVYLVANLVLSSPVAVGANATVKTTLSGGEAPETTVPGIVVSARGQADGGRWEVVIKIDNLNGGSLIFPIDYWFDAEYTHVQF